MIVACYFPDLLPDASSRPKSYREVFWKVAEGRGMNQGQILKAWNLQYGK